MDEISSLQLALQHQNQRTVALEELLRRNEQSLASVLGRVKDVEIGMNNFHKMLQHLVNENSSLSKELAASKQKTDTVDRSWRSHVQQSEQALWTEIRNSKPQPVAQDPTIQRLMQESTAQRSQIADFEIGLSRVTEAQGADTNAIRICEQHIQNAEGQLAELLNIHREGAKDTVRRFEQMFRDINQHRQDVDKTVNTLKVSTDRQLRELNSAAEQQGSNASSFQSEAGTAIRSVREELATSLAQTSQAIRSNEESAKTLEQILRAEVQTRGTNVESIVKRLGVLESAVNTKLSMVQSHQTDIVRLWDTIRSTNSQRHQIERLDNVLGSISSSSPNNNNNSLGGAAGAGGGNNNSLLSQHATANLVSLEQLRDFESATGDRFDTMDNQVIQLAETLKRAHGGVEEQVDSLASRFGRLEMRLEQVASRREDSFAAAVAAAAASSSFSSSSSAGGRFNAASGEGGGELVPNEVIVKELVDVRYRVDRLETNSEEIKFDISDLLDAISAETGDLHKRLERVEVASSLPPSTAAAVSGLNEEASSATGIPGSSSSSKLQEMHQRRLSGSSNSRSSPPNNNVVLPPATSTAAAAATISPIAAAQQRVGSASTINSNRSVRNNNSRGGSASATRTAVNTSASSNEAVLAAFASGETNAVVTPINDTAEELESRGAEEAYSSNEL